jgi:hypothetical protein
MITPEAHQQHLDDISSMSHFDMCHLWRFAPPGHPYFDSSLPYAEVFKERLFTHFKGFTPEISKALSP